MGKIYQNTFIKNYNILVKMLKSILKDNPNKDKFTFEGVKLHNIYGILVEGIDSMGIRKFKKFYPSKEIFERFDNPDGSF